MAGTAALAALAAVALAGAANGAGVVAGPVSDGSSAAPQKTAARGRSCAAAEPVPYRWASTPDALLAVRFVSASTGWALAVDRILGTSDGGAHWRVLRRRRGAQWSSLDFLDATHGWVVGAHSVLFTDDGGRHWTALPQPCPAIRTLDFVSPRRGFAIAGAGGWATLGAVWGGARTALLATGDGGRSWHRLRSPKRVQSVCFQSARDGFLGADGSIYATTDAGRRWTLSFKGVHLRSRPGVVALRCTPRGAWAEIVGPGVASSQEPHIAFHYARGAWRPIFAEQHFPHPGIRVSRESPGSYPAAFAAIDASSAAFVDSCPPCAQPGSARAPIAMARDGGAKLIRLGAVNGIDEATSASFISPSQGWVAGVVIGRTASGRASYAFQIVHTADGGRTWRTQYRSGR